MAEPGIVDAGRLELDHAVMLTTPQRWRGHDEETAPMWQVIIDTLRHEFSDLSDAAQWVAWCCGSAWRSCSAP